MLLVQSGQTLHELRQGMSKYPQQLINVKVKNQTLWKMLKLFEAVKDAEAILGTRGHIITCFWYRTRYSCHGW